MTTKTAPEPAPTQTLSLPRLRTAAVLSAFALIPATVLAVIAVLCSDRFAQCFEQGCDDTGGVTDTQLGWALAVAGLALVLVLAVPDRARRAKELRVSGLAVQLGAELTFLGMILSAA
ncbi:hypothetical protein ACFVYD_22390 [Streptomyces sp. NPDC058301]|uniref:hypothetical protein n=1 Tax=Streptomyces sp. NPDC058301 TaxID=3346436 RepID=UPI0036EC6093